MSERQDVVEAVGDFVEDFVVPKLERIAEVYGEENCGTFNYHMGLVLVKDVGWVSVMDQSVVIPLPDVDATSNQPEQL